MFELSDPASYLILFVFVAFFGLLGGLAAELLLNRDGESGTFELPKRSDRLFDIGGFATLLVEMRVKDPARYRGDGVIRINLTDDHCRIPVRIESAVPLAGDATLTLERHTHPTFHALNRSPVDAPEPR